MSTLKISISDIGSPELTKLMDSLSGNGRVSMNEAIGAEAQELTYEHLRAIAAARHATAQKLGASPTNFMAGAAEAVQAAGAMEASADAAEITIDHPGVARALRDVEIRPTTTKALAIPIDAIAYGRRAAELWDSLKLFIPKGTRIIAMRGEDKKIRPLYILCASVTQKQDRTLLPSEEEYRGAAARGAIAYLQRVSRLN
jgi:hypothetical protein